MSLYIRQLMLGPMANFVYLVGDGAAKEVAVVDPGWDADAILAAAASDGKQLVAALLTHHHYDHTNALEDLLRERPDLRVIVQRDELEFAQPLKALGAGVKPVSPGEFIEVGPLSLECIHTPGHTPGSQCFYSQGALFAGDTLFVGACGRCDLPGGNADLLFRSLHEVLAQLPDETVVYPGHDYGNKPVSTILDEKENNPFLRRSDKGGFVAVRTRLK